jgi:hypothetical protein
MRQEPGGLMSEEETSLDDLGGRVRLILCDVCTKGISHPIGRFHLSVFHNRILKRIFQSEKHDVAEDGEY